jgi:alpha-glucosidase
MQNVPIPVDRVQDPFEKNVPGKGLGRDPSRTPMLWDATRYAGFSNHRPWLPMSPDRSNINVERQAHDPASVLSLYGALLRARRSYRCLTVGNYSKLPSPRGLLVYLREFCGERLLIALNFTAEAAALPFGLGSGRILLSTCMDRADEALTDVLHLRGNEGVIAILSFSKDSP